MARAKPAVLIRLTRGTAKLVATHDKFLPLSPDRRGIPGGTNCKVSDTTPSALPTAYVR